MLSPFMDSLLRSLSSDELHRAGEAAKAAASAARWKRIAQYEFRARRGLRRQIRQAALHPSGEFVTIKTAEEDGD